MKAKFYYTSVVSVEKEIPDKFRLILSHPDLRSADKLYDEFSDFLDTAWQEIKRRDEEFRYPVGVYPTDGSGYFAEY